MRKSLMLLMLLFNTESAPMGQYVLTNPISTQSVTNPSGTTTNFNSVNLVIYTKPGDNLSTDVALVPIGGTLLITPGTYTISSGVSITCPINIQCQRGAVINSDGQSAISGTTYTFNFALGSSGSSLKGCDLEPVSAFTLLLPSKFPTPAFPVLVDRGDGIGYQPTSNDSDIYSSLTAAQQQQYVGPLIRIDDANVEVAGITGNRISVQSTASGAYFHDNNFVGGKGGVYGCLVVVGSDITTPSLLSARILQNHIRDCSFSGILIGNTTGALVSENTSEWNGESGIKTMQPFTQYPNVNYVISTNVVNNNRYYGIDGTSETVTTGLSPVFGTFTNNTSFKNGATGLTISGQGDIVTANNSYSNGTIGINLVSRWRSH